MATREIHIIRAADGYVARFVGDDEVMRLFGTDTVPTPYTLRAAADTVVRRVQALNPGHKVYLVDA